MPLTCDLSLCCSAETFVCAINSVLKSTVDSLSVVVSVGDRHPLLVTVSGGWTPSQTVRVRGAEAEDTANLMCEGAHFRV